MRHNALFRRFISALTRGGPGGLPRPIEVHAHDPLRYVGDMLGWLHQVSRRNLFHLISIFSLLKLSFCILIICTSLSTPPYPSPEIFPYNSNQKWQALASERELVLALLDPDAVVDAGSTSRQLEKRSDNDMEKTEGDLTFVLDRIFEGVCRPFKVRVEQVLQSQPNLIIACKLSNTLEFYSYTVS